MPKGSFGLELYVVYRPLACTMKICSDLSRQRPGKRMESAKYRPPFFILTDANAIHRGDSINDIESDYSKDEAEPETKQGQQRQRDQPYHAGSPDDNKKRKVEYHKLKPKIL